MAVDDILMLRGWGSVDVQIGGAGNNWAYLSACASMSGPTVPFGGTEIRWCQDPAVAGGFKVSSQFRTAPDQVSFDLMTKLGKVNYLNRLNCPFTLRARYANCGEREDPANYILMLAYCSSQLQEKSYEDLVVTDPANVDEIMVTTPVQAVSEYRIEDIAPERVGTLAGLGDQPINDIEYCDSAQCPGYCGTESDGCTTWYAVTDIDTSPYAAPNLIKGVVNLTTQQTTITNQPILGFNGNVHNVECAGSRLLIASNADSAVAYNDHDGDQDEWNIVVLANAPAANHNALFARTAREIWAGCVNGYIYKSVDGGQTFNSVHEGTLTTQTINAVYAYNKDLVYAVGNAGVILKSTDGGKTWSDKTEVATTAANLLVVKVPLGRPKEVYIGTNDGQIFRSKDEGETFANVPFVGDGVGTVDDIDFCGPCGSDIMFILHNDAGPRARILRDLSGGAGGADVEVVMDWTTVIPTGIDLNAMACCGVNNVIAAGENYGGYPVVIEAN